MPTPSTYTESALAAFVVRELGGVATQLEWVPETPQVAEAVYDCLDAYGVTDIADATDTAKLRALARVAAWRAAVSATAGNYTTSVEGMSFNREQVHAQAKGMLAEAERAASVFGVGTLSVVTSTVDRYDPYSYRLCPEWSVA